MFNNIFITVGTTEFDELLTILIENQLFIDILLQLNCKQLTIQSGRSKLKFNQLIDRCKEINIDINVYNFKPSLNDDMKSADLIISHCGSGTIIDALALDKLLLVVINDTLQGNHQIELAEILQENSYCYTTNYINILNELNSVISDLKSNKNKIQSFPKPNNDLFPRFLDSII